MTVSVKYLILIIYLQKLCQVLLTKSDTRPVTGNGFVGRRLNDQFTIPEYKIDYTKAVSIDSAEMYFVDKNGNETLFAVYNPKAQYKFKGKAKEGRFISLEDLND